MSARCTLPGTIVTVEVPIERRCTGVLIAVAVLTAPTVGFYQATDRTEDGRNAPGTGGAGPDAMVAERC